MVEVKIIHYRNTHLFIIDIAGVEIPITEMNALLLLNCHYSRVEMKEGNKIYTLLKNKI